MPTLIPSSEDVRIYEIAVMLQPDLQPKEESTLMKEIEDVFADAGAKLLFKDPWTKRGLAYKIKGYQEAKFFICYYEVDPAKIRDLDHALQLLRGVLRHLLVLPPKGYEAVSFEESYQLWLKTRETAAQTRAREKEEKVKQSLIAQAKRESRKLREVKPKEKAAPVQMKQLEEQLEKLIADADIDL